jgi:hypothetical protein
LPVVALDRQSVRGRALLREAFFPLGNKDLD